MNQSAEARVLTTPEPVRPASLPVRDQLHATAHAVAWGDDAAARNVMNAFSWERRGLLGTLVRRSRG